MAIDFNSACIDQPGWDVHLGEEENAMTFSLHAFLFMTCLAIGLLFLLIREMDRR